jgi:hypothetical protein
MTISVISMRFLSLVLAATSAVACPESQEDILLSNTASAMKQASVVVSARVLSAHLDRETSVETARLQVERVYKGNVSESLVVKHTINMCVPQLPVGQVVFVFLKYDDRVEDPTSLIFINATRSSAAFAATLESSAARP